MENKEDKKKKSIFGGLFDKLKGVKHFEIIVLVVAAVLVGIIFFSTLNLTGNNNNTVGGYETESNLTSKYDSELEIRLAKILSSIKGAGNVSVMIGEKNSVLVVAAGASDIGVRMEIIKAVKSVLQIESNLIEVIVGK